MRVILPSTDETSQYNRANMSTFRAKLFIRILLNSGKIGSAFKTSLKL